MKPNEEFKNLGLEFFANIKLLNQRLGYSLRRTKKKPEGGFLIPNVKQVKKVFKEEGLNHDKLISGNQFTDYGQKLVDYMIYREKILIEHVEPHLMNKDEAKKLFYKMKEEYRPNCPLPMNKQKREKKDYSFLTGLVNMIIEKNIGNDPCNYDPKELTAITDNDYPIRTLSRRVDGAYPKVINPIAIWEIKEYYYTTTFGSRIADGVYETQLDGWELREAESSLKRKVLHYLIIDDHNTWWGMGKSYLCRIIDSLHMGLVTEVLFGSEIVERLPVLVSEWKKYPEQKDLFSVAAEPKE